MESVVSDSTLNGTDREIVEAVRERGLDWLFQTLYDNYCVDAEYIRTNKKVLKVRVVEVERFTRPDNGKKLLKQSAWKYDQSVLMMALDVPDELYKKWPKEGERLRMNGRLYEVSLGHQFCVWFKGEQPIPAWRLFFKEIAEQ